MKIKSICCVLLCICLLSGCNGFFHNKTNLKTTSKAKTKIALTVNNIHEYFSFEEKDMTIWQAFEREDNSGNTRYNIWAAGDVVAVPKKDCMFENVVISGEASTSDSQWRNRRGETNIDSFTIEISPGEGKDIIGFGNQFAKTKPTRPPQNILFKIEGVSGYAIV